MRELIFDDIRQLAFYVFTVSQWLSVCVCVCAFDESIFILTFCLFLFEFEFLNMYESFRCHKLCVDFRIECFQLHRQWMPIANWQTDTGYRILNHLCMRLILRREKITPIDIDMCIWTTKKKKFVSIEPFQST